MTYQELFDEVAELRKLVNALCVAQIEERADPVEERVRMSLKSPSGSHGYRLFRTGVGQAMLDDLEHQKQVLLEDYPNLKVKS